MRSNRWRDTQPEVAVRSLLHRQGLRFRKRLTIRLGERRWTQPDLVLSRSRVVLFVDGCFWHSCPIHGVVPKSNRAYWEPKLARNVARDRDTDRRLRALGWHVIRAWEHEDPEQVAAAVAQAHAERSASRAE
jgi:DNA mismatch endonuclease (patch repair protein)